MKKIKLNIKFGNFILIAILVMIFIITALISFKTELNSHPDEKAHYDAVYYFQKHNLPPKFTSDEIEYSFSQYGESRLTELDAYYFLVGKYSSVINLFSNNEVFNARSFNLILLLIILIMCYKLYREKSYLFMPFLLTSQLWYIFSYINNDAWAIFLNLIFVYQLFFKKSMFNKLIDETKENLKNDKKVTAISFILLGLLFYLLLIIKINYVLATGVCAIIYLIVNSKKCFKKENLLKIGTILLIGIILFGIRLGIDFTINGLDRMNMEQVRLLRASKEYKPPYSAEWFKLKEKGESIDKIIKNNVFYDQTKKSFVGLYGYMNKPILSETYYKIILDSYIIFILYIIVVNIINRKKEDEDESYTKGRIMPVILALLSGVLIFGLIIYRSYTYDFQAQGRYLFPIIPIICAIMYNQKKNKILDAFFFIISISLIIMYYKYGYCAF